MTKNEFRYRVLRHLLAGNAAKVMMEGPVYWWEKTWTLYIEAAKPCFFPSGWRPSGGQPSRIFELGGAHSRGAAEAKVAKYQRWIDEAIAKEKK